MDAEINKAICRRFIQKIFNEGELPLVWDFMTPDAIIHEIQDSLGPGPLPQKSDPCWLKEIVDLYRYAFPDLHFEIQSQVAEGDRVVTSLRMRGTHRNPLMTIKASGNTIDITGIRIDRFKNGKIAESWFHFDSLTMLRQIDALPHLARKPVKMATAPRETTPELDLPCCTGPPPHENLPGGPVQSGIRDRFAGTSRVWAGTSHFSAGVWHPPVGTRHRLLGTGGSPAGTGPFTVGTGHERTRTRHRLSGASHSPAGIGHFLPGASLFPRKTSLFSSGMSHPPASKRHFLSYEDIRIAKAIRIRNGAHDLEAQLEIELERIPTDVPPSGDHRRAVQRRGEGGGSGSWR